MSASETARLNDEMDMLISALTCMVYQHCFQYKEGEFDSQCLSANAEALDALVALGKMEYLRDPVGRAATARFVDE